MKLFTFLLLDDSVVRNLLKPLYPEEEPRYPEYIETPKNNRFYSYGDMPEILFMSYKYTNVATDVLNESENNTRWGYVIIDNESESDIKNRIDLLGAIRKHKNWGIDKDNKKFEARYLETSNYLTVDTKLGLRCYKVPIYRRYGGHLGAGRTGKRTETLHELVLKTKCDSFNRINTKSIPCKIKRTIKGVEHIYDGFHKVTFDYDRNEIKTPRIHHKGHTFDNRVQYLMPLSGNDHNDIHKLETDTQFAFRTKYIGYYKDTYSEKIYCDCENKGNDCLSCSAILSIKNDPQFFKFIESLRSKDYKSLERRRIYDELKMNRR